MGLLISAAVLLFGFGAAYVASEEVRYVTRAGIEQPLGGARMRPVAMRALVPIRRMLEMS